MRERDWQSLKEEIANADEEDEEVVLDDSAKSSPAIRRSLRSMESAQP